MSNKEMMKVVQKAAKDFQAKYTTKKKAKELLLKLGFIDKEGKSIVLVK